jgi:hypothetical protein
MRINDLASSQIATNNEAVTLYLACDELGGSACDQVRFSNDGTFDSAPEDWQTVGPTAIWTLTAGEGSKTVWGEGKDLAGNIHQVTTVIELDQTKPVITLVNPLDNPQNVFLGNAYIEAGATVSDNFDTGLSAVIDASAVVTSVVGDYPVYYDVTDAAGNAAVRVTRTVHVFNQAQPPSLFTVPTSSTTGDFTLSWVASADAEGYEVEESTSGTFTGTPTYTLATAVSSFNVTGRTPGTYSYRIRGTKSGLVSSDWVVSGNYCNVVEIASMTSPSDGATLSGTSQTFNWNNVDAVNYQLWVGTSVGAKNIAQIPLSGSTTSTTVSGIPVDGSPVYVRLFTQLGLSWYYNDYSYTSNSAAVMISPTNNSTFSSSNVTFGWSNVGASNYQVWVGTSVGAKDLRQIVLTGVSTSIDVSNLPVNGTTIYVRLYTQFGITWVSRDYIYTAAKVPASMTSPTDGSTLYGSNPTFQWTDVGATGYQLWVGTTLGAKDLKQISMSGSTTATIVNDLPVDGSAVYVRLYTQHGSTWHTNDYSYVATLPAIMTTPMDRSTLLGNSQTFSWNDVGAGNYQLWVGTSFGAKDLGQLPLSGSTTNTLVTGLPVNGADVYVRLYSQFGTTWYYNDYSYTTNLPSIMSSPVNESTLLGPVQTFSWNNSGATNYQLWVGSSVGGRDFGQILVSETSTSTTVAGLPLDGRTVYVRLYSQFGTTWYYNDYIYGTKTPAVMIAPTNGSILSGPDQTFSWNNADAVGYQIWVGSSLGAKDLKQIVLSSGTTSTTISELPVNGNTLYIRLYSQFGNVWTFNDYSYGTKTPAIIITPTDNSTLAGASQDFSWNNVDAVNYQLWLGTSLGAKDLKQITFSGSITNVMVNGLPVDGSTIYARLYSQFGTIWYYSDFIYTASGL